MQSVPPNGIDPFSIAGTPLTGEDFAKFEVILKTAYNKNYDRNLFRLLFDMVVDDGWTRESLEYALKQMIKRNKWATWTIADFYSYAPRLYPYSYYLANKAKPMEAYKVGGLVLWKERDGIELPFERVEV